MKKKSKGKNLRNILLPKKEQDQYCRFCKLGINYVDHKKPKFSYSFLNPEGKILPRRYTGNCIKHQKVISAAIKRSRQLAFLPYTANNLK